VRLGQKTSVNRQEGIMFDFMTNRKTVVPHKSLYCGWIRAHEGDDAPLIRVWIDPSMTMFELGAKVHEPDVESARAVIQEALRKGSAS
jgi:hypothetical protein